MGMKPVSNAEMIRVGLLSMLAFGETKFSPDPASTRRRVPSTNCCYCGCDIPPGRPGRRCKVCRAFDVKP